MFFFKLDFFFPVFLQLGLGSGVGFFWLFFLLVYLLMLGFFFVLFKLPI